MATRRLDKKEWRSFLDRLSTALEGKQAEIEIVSLQLGDQIEADWLPLLGIAYDPNDDIVEVALEDLDHLIAKPRGGRDAGAVGTKPARNQSCRSPRIRVERRRRGCFRRRRSARRANRRACPPP